MLEKDVFLNLKALTKKATEKTIVYGFETSFAGFPDCLITQHGFMRLFELKIIKGDKLFFEPSQFQFVKASLLKNYILAYNPVFKSLFIFYYKDILNKPHVTCGKKFTVKIIDLKPLASITNPFAKGSTVIDTIVNTVIDFEKYLILTNNLFITEE